MSSVETWKPKHVFSWLESLSPKLITSDILRAFEVSCQRRSIQSNVFQCNCLCLGRQARKLDGKGLMELNLKDLENLRFRTVDDRKLFLRKVDILILATSTSLLPYELVDRGEVSQRSLRVPKRRSRYAGIELIYHITLTRWIYITMQLLTFQCSIAWCTKIEAQT